MQLLFSEASQLCEFTTGTDDVFEMNSQECSMAEFFFNKYSGLLYGTILRIVGDQRSAEEVFQDVLMKLRVELKRPPQEHQLRLITRMTQLARSLAKAKINTHLETASFQVNPDFIKSLLSGLSQIEREVVKWIVLEGRSQRDVAESLNVPLSAIRTHTRTAMLKIHQWME
jgi:RNA polymerase sigma-70 factor (ECF subfamily)